MTEVAQLQSLTHGQRRYLSRRVCALCDQPLNVPSCAALYFPCSEETRAERRANCLQHYKPRDRKKATP